MTLLYWKKGVIQDEATASTVPYSFSIPNPTDESSSSSSSSTTTTTTTTTTIHPVCVGHLAHAHEAALQFENDNNNDQVKLDFHRLLHKHESERLASWQSPQHPKAATLLPVISGQWCTAPLFAPRPRDPVRGGGRRREQEEEKEGTLTQHWETRGAIFWHATQVGSQYQDAAKLIWNMEDAGALPICNSSDDDDKDNNKNSNNNDKKEALATHSKTRSFLRFLGRYTINDYGMSLAQNRSLDDNNPRKAMIEYNDEAVSHTDILLKEEGQDPSLGSVCFFVTPQDYWNYIWPDLCTRKELLEADYDDDDDEEDDSPNIDEIAIPDGLHVLQTHGSDDVNNAFLHGALCVARRHDYMFLRAFLDPNTDNTGVQALIFYYSVGPDEWSFSEWRVGKHPTLEGAYAPVVPTRLPPGGAITRNDQIDDLYGCRPFDHAVMESFIENYLSSDEALRTWWNSLTTPYASCLVERIIKGGFLALFNRLMKITGDNNPKSTTQQERKTLDLYIMDRKYLICALDVPELKPSVAPTLAYQNASSGPLQQRLEMIQSIVANAKRKDVMRAWIEEDFEEEEEEEEEQQQQQQRDWFCPPPEKLLGRVENIEVNRLILEAHPFPSVVLARARGYEGFPDENGERGMRPLMDAAESGNSALVQLYTSLGASPLATCQRGWSAFAFAAASGSADCVRALVEAMSRDHPNVPYMDTISSAEIPLSFVKPSFSTTNVQGNLADVAIYVLVLGLGFHDLLQEVVLESSADAMSTSVTIRYALTRGNLKALQLSSRNNRVMKEWRQRQRNEQKEGQHQSQNSRAKDDNSLNAAEQSSSLAVNRWTKKYESCILALLEMGLDPSRGKGFQLAIEQLKSVNLCMTNEDAEQLKRKVSQLIKGAQQAIGTVK